MPVELQEQLVDWIRTRYFGKYRGVVVDNADPTNRGRLKVRIPAVLGDQQVWAMPCVPLAGDNAGFYMMPEPGTGVWLELEGGDPSYVIWTGCFWGDGQRPADEKGARVTPPVKVIRTKQGLMLTLDDDRQTISLSDEDASNIVTIDVQSGQVTVKGASKVVVEAQQIELVENASHPVVFGDTLLNYLRSLELTFNTHQHTVGSVVSGPPVVPVTQSASPSLYSSQVKTG